MVHPHKDKNRINLANNVFLHKVNLGYLFSGYLLVVPV